MQNVNSHVVSVFVYGKDLRVNASLAENLLPDLDDLLSGKTVFGNQLGDSFVPKMRCPIRRGNYRFNITIRLHDAAAFPPTGEKYEGRLCFYEKNDRIPACVEMVFANV